MSREHLPRERRRAMEILDLVRAGVPVPWHEVMRALIITGDAQGVELR